MDVNMKMAARDLAAAALAVQDGRNVTALTLALDAICSITCQAAEGRGTFIPFGDEVSNLPAMAQRSGSGPWTEARAKELHTFANRMLNMLPTTWASVKRFRELLLKKAP